MEETVKLISVQFKDTFELLRNVLLFWEEHGRLCQSTVRKILNLTEQLDACHNVDLKKFPTKFPSDIKNKLVYKIQIALDEELRDLYQTLSLLEERQNEVKSLCYRMNKAYREQSRGLKLSCVIRATATCPAISDMLEYLNQFQHLLITDYLCRKITLKKFSPNDKSTITDFKKNWKEVDFQKSVSSNLYMMLNWPVIHN